MSRTKFVQVENKNALLELLEEGKTFEKIFIANNAFKDPKTRRIVELAGQKGILVEKVARRSISRRSKTSSKESVIGLMRVDNQFDLTEVLDEIFDLGLTPFVLIFNDIRYPYNIGAIFRTAYAAGVNCIITPIQKGNLLSDEVIRISMGTCLRIPIVEMSLFTAIKVLQKNAVEIVGVNMEGQSMYTTDLTGPKAFLMGSEDIGISSKMIDRADKLISIPMKGGLGSLNVSVASSLVMYEKARQDLGSEGSPLRK
ncbi:RNA methyltransferase [Candidatus Nomurabacteria bacterium]|uniref:RNA methyltransferase n=1 Tax=Candidatus Dojkabacteria bacterium TaxID=2099670 RepID=A0A955I4P2_9BACT|nr:RNA methyltransferase [Candidatus Dojkabacteria bacterium]MCB9790157.1 RNA methyltransferase [Candidatus Nomurabacteria bacterium]MCB9803323.1 RNA methyltransferase [Candidatus Nomurabacteria bacterium]